jgi:hypothetical protein
VDELVAFFQSGRYRPLQNSDDVVMTVALMIVLNVKRATPD